MLTDAKGNPFISCEYNRDGDCFRSPWDNKYYIAEGTEGEVDGEIFPSQELRELEVKANYLF